MSGHSPVSGRRTVLMVVFQFPPLTGGGVPRPLGFVRHLRSHGWEPVVITVLPRWLDVADRTLLKFVPSDITVIRVFAWPLWKLPNVLGRIGLPRLADWTHRLFFPDTRIGWAPFVRRKVRRLLDSRQIDLIWTTSPPYSSARLGMQLAREHGLPWIADFRDNWVANPSIVWMDEKSRQRAGDSLRLWLRHAACVTTVSEPFADEFRQHAPSHVNVAILPNGFENLVPQAGKPDQGQTTQAFKLCFTGAFYAGRKPDALFSALELLLDRGLIGREEICLCIAGRNPVKVPEGLRSMVRQLGYMYYEDVRKFMQMSDALLLVLSPEERGTYSTKLPEYLAAGKYVLGLVPTDGVAADLIRKSGAGVVAPPDDSEAIAEAILILYRKWRHGETHPVLDHEIVGQFSMETLTRRLAGIFDSVLEQWRGPG